MSDGVSILPAVEISTSGLEAQARRMEVVADNIANMNTTRGSDGKVFRRKEVVFAAKLRKAVGDGMASKPGGVRVAGVAESSRDPKRIYRPGHPDADKDGYIEMPAVNAVEEMIEMMEATRAYEANLAAIRAAKNMAAKALEIGK